MERENEMHQVEAFFFKDRKEVRKNFLKKNTKRYLLLLIHLSHTNNLNVLNFQFFL